MLPTLQPRYIPRLIAVAVAIALARPEGMYKINPAVLVVQRHCRQRKTVFALSLPSNAQSLHSTAGERSGYVVLVPHHQKWGSPQIGKAVLCARRASNSLRILSVGYVHTLYSVAASMCLKSRVSCLKFQAVSMLLHWWTNQACFSRDTAAVPLMMKQIAQFTTPVLHLS